MSDTENITKNVVFNSNLNTHIIEELKCDINKPIIKITKYRIENKCIVMIDDFKLFQEVTDVIGLPQTLTKLYYDSLRNHRGWPSTPSRMKSLR